MLLELKVKNLGIIEDLDWSPERGLNVITGETGAGKSLVIDALEMLLSGKMEEDAIRHGAVEAHIEGIFTLKQGANRARLQALLADIDPADEDSLIISCNVKHLRPAVVRINGQSVPKSLLRQVGRDLVDIHGQSEHLSLLDKNNHLDFLDAFAHAGKLRTQFAGRVAQLEDIEAEREALEKEERDNARREEFLRFQIAEIEKARLRNGEEEELEKERHLISFSARLKEYSQRAYQALYEGDSSGLTSPALQKLNEAAHSLKKLADLDPSLKTQLEWVEKSIYGLEEVARDVRDYGDRLENDPRRLEEIENRLQLIRTLKKKYGQNVAEILEHGIRCEKELEEILHSAEKSLQLRQEIQRMKQAMGQLGEELSALRIQGARRLEKEVGRELSDLEMGEVSFRVAIGRTLAAEGVGGVDGQVYAYSSDGIDNVEFMAATNPGEPARPLAKIASTGEISRFTLALKGALSEVDQIPVLVFDEIDIGVGGRSGETIGKKLWALARNHQVICVTHLPQIAAFADAHFGVHKEAAGERTVSILDNLKAAPRKRELAMMLSGKECTTASLTSAAELIENAEKWKSVQQGQSRMMG